MLAKEVMFIEGLIHAEGVYETPSRTSVQAMVATRRITVLP
jgi:hypothetical protein